MLLRTDLDAPVMDVQSEGDISGILDSYAARQPDNDHFRLWEVAGTSHADAHLLGANAASIDCGVPVNNGPLHIVAKAALHALDQWVRTGEAPPEAPRLEVVAGDPVTTQRDADGIALGAIRTPPVDVPVDVLSGQPGPNSDVICLLLGSTVPLPADRLAAMYASRADYEQRYADATDRAIAAGFVLEDDRAALMSFAQPTRIG
ncbi:MAG: alpha/beta hydrolase domain-containing protein [Acidimicrobiales bacterium]